MRVKDKTQGLWKGYCCQPGLGLIILLYLVVGMTVSSPLIVKEGVSGVIVGIAGTLTVLLTFGRKILREYLQLKVKGYLYVVWYDPEGDCIRDELFSNSGKHIAGNEEYLYRSVSDYSSYPCIWASLGGWLADFSTDCYQGHGNPSSHWAVSVAKIGISTLSVTMTDMEGQSLTMEIVRMLQLFCTRSDQVAYWPQRVEELVITLAENRDQLLECLDGERRSVEKRTHVIEELTEELKASNDMKERLQAKLDYLIENSLKALELLANVQIFGRSKGAPGVRKMLAFTLTHVVDKDDARRQRVLTIDRIKDKVPKQKKGPVAAQT